MEIIYIILVGLIAGWLSGLIMKGKGFGILLDIIIGILGAIVGKWLLMDVLSLNFAMDTLNLIITAIIGSVFLLFIFGVLRALFSK